MSIQIDAPRVPGTILLISDDPVLSEFVESALAPRGYQLALRGGTENNLREILDNLKPEVVIIDIMIPKMKGIETALYIRQWCPARTILLSSWNAEPGKIRSFDIHSANCLSESFGAEKLVEWIGNSGRGNW